MLFMLLKLFSLSLGRCANLPIYAVNAIFTLSWRVCYFAIYADAIFTLSWKVYYFAIYAINAIHALSGGVLFYYLC